MPGIGPIPSTGICIGASLIVMIIILIIDCMILTETWLRRWISYTPGSLTNNFNF